MEYRAIGVELPECRAPARQIQIIELKQPKFVELELDTPAVWYSGNSTLRYSQTLKDKSTALMCFVNAPTEIRSIPVAATCLIVARLMFPDTSNCARP